MTQEQVFKWLGICGHKIGTVKKKGGGMMPQDREYEGCIKCELILELCKFIDLPTPEGMVLILDRLVEKGWNYIISSSERYREQSVVQINNYSTLDIEPHNVHVIADTPHLAVYEAVSKLVERASTEKTTFSAKGLILEGEGGDLV